MEPQQTVLPPETIEGWYALHQVFSLDRIAMRGVSALGLESMQESARHALKEISSPKCGGWSAVVPLLGSRADVMLMHFRPSLDDLGATQRRIAREPLFDLFRMNYSFLSVTEAALYNVTAHLEREARKRGGSVSDAEYQQALSERLATERGTPHVKKRLYPALPPELPYVSFYPMSKRRANGQNWYALTLEERSRLMRAHGLTGRRYAGKVMQIITGSIGFEGWEWGVTLFASDPLHFKKLVTEMRFDEVSAKYADFGEFFVGRVQSAEEWLGSLV